MPGVAGEVKVIFKADTASYTASVKAAKQQLGVFEQSATSAGKAARAQFADARGTVMVLGEEIGVHLPRHVQAFIAKLPGAASALSAAFSATAVLAIGIAVVDVGKKIYEFAAKNEEAARKNAAAWREISGSMQATNDELRVTNDKLEMAIAKLEHKPQNGLKLAIDEAIQSADILGEKLNTDAQKIAETLKLQEPSLTARFFNVAAGTGDITQHARGLQSTLDGFDVEESTRLAALRKQSATQEQIDAATAELNRKRKAAIDQELSTWATPELAKAQDIWNREPKIGPFGNQITPEIQGRRDVLVSYAAALARMSDFVDLTQTHASLSGHQALGAMATSTTLAPGYDSRASNLSRIPGAAAWSDWLQAAAMQEALDAQKGQTLGGSGTFAAYSHLWPETNPNVTLGNTAAIGGFGIGGSSAAAAGRWAEEFQKKMQETIKQFTDLDDILANFTIRTLESFNETLIKVLSTPESMLRGKHPWRQLGASTAESAGSAALKYGEGAAMKELGNIPGIGKFFKATHKPTGSESDPIWVKLVDGGAGPMSSSMGNVGSSIISSLFGGGGASGAGAGMGSAGASLISSLFSGGGGAAATGAGSALGAVGAGIAGFAEGGMIPSNVPSIVGEKGPELFVPSTSGRIAPNGSFGGAPVINIDNRGVNDPAASAAAIHRAMAVYLPHIGNMAMSASRDNRRRVPLSKARG